MTVMVVPLGLVVLSAHLATANPLAVRGRSRAAFAGTGPQDGTAGADEAALRALLRGAPLQMLFHRWHATSRVMADAGGGQGHAAAVCLRGLLLDELHARDPSGAQRWIDRGSTHPPERHIRSEETLPG